MKRVNRTLTAKQKNTLDFITSFRQKHGYAPSLEEIADHFDLSAISTAHHHVKALIKKGYLKKEKNQPRGITPLENKKDIKEISLLGTIAAGKPIEPFEDPEPINIPNEMIAKPGNYYALKVKGSSMIEDGICDGDVIIVKHQQTADDNETVVAVTEEGATLKRLRKKGGKIYLEPKNSRLKNIYPKQLEIRGRFIGLIRNN